MASNNNNDLPNKFPLTGTTCGPPKAQLPLQKILLNPNSSTPNQVHHVNASAAAASSSSTSLSVLNVSEYDSVPMGYNLFDLNHPPPPETHHDSPSPVLHGAAEKFQECNLKSPEEKKVTSMLLDKSCENEMETNNVGLGSNSERPPESKERAEIKEVGEGEREVRKSEIRFGALLDAVECAMVEEYGGTPSELSKGEERNESTGKKRQRVEWKTGDEEEEKSAMAVAAAAEEVSTSPVVKSNRGRIQVLPCKYRDSVIEPLTHLSSRHSRSSPSTFGPTKRRSR